MSYSLGLLFAFLHASIWAVSAIFLRVAATQLDGFLKPPAGVVPDSIIEDTGGTGNR